MAAVSNIKFYENGVLKTPREAAIGSTVRVEGDFTHDDPIISVQYWFRNKTNTTWLLLSGTMTYDSGDTYYMSDTVPSTYTNDEPINLDTGGNYFTFRINYAGGSSFVGGAQLWTATSQPPETTPTVGTKYPLPAFKR